MLVLILIVFSAFMVPKPARSQAPSTDSRVREVHLRMCASGLTPITPPEDETARRKTIPSGFEQRYTRLRGDLRYKRVGEWKLDNIASVIKIQQPLKFIIWLSTTGQTTGDIRMTLRYGATVVAGPTETHVTSLDGEATRFEIPSHANLTTTKGGEPITLLIEAKVNGDGMMVEYGDFQKDSGVMFMCDAIKYVSLKADSGGVHAEFVDSFRASLNNLYPKLYIDGVQVMNVEDGVNRLDRGISDQANYLFSWNVHPKKGEHMFEVGIAYADKDINTSWNIQKAITIRKKGEAGFFDGMEFGNKVALVFFVLCLLVYFIVALSIIRRRANARNLYSQRSPIPFKYKMIVNKRMANFTKKKGIPPPRPTKKKKMSFHAKKKGNAGK